VPSLIEIQLDVLFTRTARGELLVTRDPSPRPAPRVFLGRSADANVWAVHRDVDSATKVELARVLSAEPRLLGTDFARGPECSARVRGLLSPAAVEFRGPAYVLSEELPRDDRAREITAGESSEWREAFPWLTKEFAAVAPVVIAFEAGQPAAICHSARGLSTAAAEAGVETVEHFRGRGLATAAVACWARAVQRRGRFALYSTSWENKASQAVARRLSARLYGEDWQIA
jgi:GNAT acetyltransferase-like protein